MPIPVGFMRTTCQDCGWSTVTYQHSDVLITPHRCPRCQSVNLRHSKEKVPDPLSLLLGRLRRWMR